MKKQITLVLALVITAATFAQKAKVLEGDFKDLKGITEYNLVFDYSDLEIPKYDNEEDFLKDKMAKREEKKAGDGERFKKSWFSDREERYEPKFIESFNKRYDEFQVGKDLPNAEYTMKIHTTLLYAGYNVGVMRQPSKVDAIISVYKTGSPDNIIFSVKYKKAEGNGAMGYDFDSGYRISESYAKLAKTLAKTINKKAW
ncbi:hypothetical protein ULMS_07230 [Patiriisocius marinistellae]|uniref:DUF4468 domain-containing protein n=1 Tax=Patiriisocius marinistellae TaxID=2494560 RepID=A0A5J4FYX1_9FLAO|nr:hypothetical protein [Patiriisocius marinistellae]GEQ85215.1 hypothetical protein ULMS_07230 [Patiriisocius marinistellae]